MIVVDRFFDLSKNTHAFNETIRTLLRVILPFFAIINIFAMVGLQVWRLSQVPFAIVLLPVIGFGTTDRTTGHVFIKAEIAWVLAFGLEGPKVGLAYMDGVVPDRPVFQIGMAIRAADHFLQVVAAGKAGAVGMHLFCLVARHTVHVVLCGVDITLATGSVILHADAAAVTGGTLIDRITVLVEFMAVNETPLGELGSTDMTATTTVGMAGCAML